MSEDTLFGGGEIGEIETLEIKLLLEAIFQRYHYDFREYSARSIHRRVMLARAHFGCASISALQEKVLREPAVIKELLNFLTVQVSELFRDPLYFKAIRENVIPHLRTYPSLKVWVAGCADGEELYSLAILFREEGLEHKTLFYATDINPRALARAESGIYGIDRIAQFTDNHRRSGGKSSLSDYYTAGYGAVVLDKTLRARTVFAEHSLVSDEVFSEVHLVSSRNVLIYFDRGLQDRAIGLFRDSLVHGGFLGLGSKETIRFSRHAEDFSSFDSSERLFRRQVGVAAQTGDHHAVA